MGVPKPTEMTIRDLLQEELRKRGVTVVPEFSVSTPTGILKPDILLRNGAPYVVETKLGTETKLLDAMVKLYDYSKYVTEAKGAFAVLFPEELRRTWDYNVILSIATNPKTEYVVTAIFKDLRPSQRFAGNLSEISDWMAGHVLRAPVVEADTGFAIRVLRDAVSYITASVRQLRGKELEDIFGGKTVFENILEYEEGKYPVEEMRQAATYLLVNQLLFYHLLTKEDLSLPAIDEEKISRPADLAQYFDPILKTRNYSSIFGFDVVSRLPVDATEVVKKVIMVVKALGPDKIRHDLLGKVFHELIPFEIRKAVAAFYTNNEAAEILAQLAIDKPDAKVMDLAVGSGTLLVAAYRRKRELLKKTKGTFELEKDHKRFLEEDLTGIDIMPFAAHLAVVHLSLQALLSETEKVRVAVWDSTELKPGQTIPAIRSELRAAYRRPTLDMFAKGGLPEEAYVTRGTVTMEGVGGEKIPLEQADLVIMNPPFTRERRMPQAYKEILLRRFQDYKKYLHGQLGLYGYFVFLADRFTKKDGRIALVLPTSLLRIPAAEELRKFLVENYNFEYIITTWQRSAFSESARFREMLLVAKKKTGKVTSNSWCNIVAIKKLPMGLDEAREYSQRIRQVVSKLDAGEVYDDETLNIRAVKQSALKESLENLFAQLSVSNQELFQTLQEITRTSRQKTTELKKYLDEVGGEYYRFDTWFEGHKLHEMFICNPSRAIKKIDRWTIKQSKKNEIIAENKFTQAVITIPKNVTRFSLRRPAGTGVYDLTANLDYIVVDSFPQLQQLLEKRKIEEMKAILPKWKRFVEEKTGMLLLSQDVNISAPGTKLFAYYTSLPAVGEHMWNFNGLSHDSAKILTLWFNSTPFLLWALINRVEVEGAWMKFHSYLVDKSIILNIEKLSEVDKKLLLESFDAYKNENFPSLLQQLKTKFSGRVEIDKSLLKVLGFGEDETSRILDFLYSALAKEIEQLKALMQG